MGKATDVYVVVVVSRWNYRRRVLTVEWDEDFRIGFGRWRGDKGRRKLGYLQATNDINLPYSVNDYNTRSYHTGPNVCYSQW